MSPAEQQKHLVEQMANQQEGIARALDDRQAEMMMSLDYKTRRMAEKEIMNQMKQHRSRKDN